MKVDRRQVRKNEIRFAGLLEGSRLGLSAGLLEGCRVTRHRRQNSHQQCWDDEAPPDLVHMVSTIVADLIRSARRIR